MFRIFPQLYQRWGGNVYKFSIKSVGEFFTTLFGCGKLTLSSILG